MFTPDGRSGIVERLVERARADPRVNGAARTGSGAAGTADRWSDVDLFLGLTADADPGEVVEDWSSWAHGALGAVHHFDLTGGGATYRAFLLADGLEIDLGFAPAGAFRRMGGESFGVLFGEPAAELPATPPDTNHLIGLAWHHVLHGRTAIERDRPWSAEYWISALRDQVLALACARLGLPTAHGRGFDQLPADITDPLRAALPAGIDRPELRRALRGATTALLVELRALGTAPELQTLEATLLELADLGR